AFAMEESGGDMTDFVFPSVKDDVGTNGYSKKIGDYCLAGRGNLKNVTLPSNSFGRTKSVKLPDGMFMDCYNLEQVTFPTDGSYSSGRVSYDPSLFNEVTNKNFIVRGPESKQENNQIDYADPRTSTWEAVSIAHDGGTGIPYVFERNGVLYYEICQDNMLMLIDEAGNLQSCSFVPGLTEPEKNSVAGVLEIPGKVGDTPLKSIASGSFDTDDIKEYITEIVFPDDTDESQLTEIGDGVFKDCPKLKKIVIGNTINTIGKEAFAECGTTNPNTKVQVEFRAPKDGYENFAMGKDAFTTGGTPLEFKGDVVKGYAPFDYAMDPDTYANADTGLRVCYKSQRPENITVILDNATKEPTLVDYPLYEEIDKKNKDYIKEIQNFWVNYYSDEQFNDYRASGEDGPWNGLSYYDTYPYSILDLYENGNEYTEQFKRLTPEGEAIVNAALNVVVPRGVTSIDAYAYYNDHNTVNGVNITAYLSDGFDGSNVDSPYNKYTEKGLTDPNAVDVVPGLFSGYFIEPKSCETANSRKGNDHIQSITLYDVKTLPDYAFDNCEALEAVSLGEALEDIGTAPFRGCTNLTSVGGNDKYVCENGIVYSKNTDNTYMIEECLPARGTLVGEAVINSTNDPLLKEVGYIQEGAFEECNDIVRVYLDDATKLATIPKRAFKKCEKLTEVTLPSSIKQIQDEAFAGDDRMNVTIYGKEVSITTDAFEHKPSVEIRTYEDSAALTYAKYYEMGWSIIGEKYRVLFLDWDGLQLDEQFVEEGGSAKELDPQPTRDGYTFTGWKGGNMDNIQQDTILIAQYTSNSGTGGSGTGGSGTGGSGSGSGSGSSSSSKDDDDDDDDDDDVHTVVVVNGMGSGRYKKGRTVTITANPAPEGKRFWMWTTESENVALGSAENSTTTFKMPDNRVTVTANYQDGSSGSSVTYSTTKSPSVVGGSSGGSGSGSVTGSGTGSSNGSGAGDTTGGTTQTPKEKTNAEIMITKPGISDTDKASAKVNGSTDNFIVRITD
ncbi:MAG: leucine-rich repeat protein, partial [Lachnospiraceae bacterium]|nr:leucine-rich repeat protein [Lachnospiraceae bacterium]